MEGGKLCSGLKLPGPKSRARIRLKEQVYVQSLGSRGEPLHMEVQQAFNLRIAHLIQYQGMIKKESIEDVNKDFTKIKAGS